MTREFPPPDARLEGKVRIFQFSAQRDVLGVASSDGHDTGGGKASWRDNSFSAKDLQTMAFPPLAWIVPNIIPAEGVTLLCSKPKFGKSWFALDLVIACTTDRFTLGETKPM
jgi:AAA domain